MTAYRYSDHLNSTLIFDTTIDTLVLDQAYGASSMSVVPGASGLEVRIGGQVVTLAAAGGTYSFKVEDGLVAAGQTFTFDASALARHGGQAVSFDGSAETNGKFHLIGS